MSKSKILCLYLREMRITTNRNNCLKERWILFIRTKESILTIGWYNNSVHGILVNAVWVTQVGIRWFQAVFNPKSTIIHQWTNLCPLKAIPSSLNNRANRGGYSTLISCREIRTKNIVAIVINWNVLLNNVDVLQKKKGAIMIVNVMRRNAPIMSIRWILMMMMRWKRSRDKIVMISRINTLRLSLITPAFHLTSVLIQTDIADSLETHGWWFESFDYPSEITLYT